MARAELISAGAAVASVIAALAAIYVAVDANTQAGHTEAAQRSFTAEIEERESAPVLAPDVEPRLYAKPVTVPTDVGTVKKRRAERLFVNPDTPQVIVPMRNVGDGVAVIPVTVSFRDDCPGTPDGIPPLLRKRRAGYLGPYNIPAGESRQLSFGPLDRHPKSARPYVDARRATDLHLMVLYTDLLGRKLRWTCVSYTRPKATASWSVKYPYYDDMTLPRRR